MSTQLTELLEVEAGDTSEASESPQGLQVKGKRAGAVGLCSVALGLACWYAAAHVRSTMSSMGGEAEQKFSSSWKDEVLKAHNEYRAYHDAPPLTWSNSLARNADSCQSRNYYRNGQWHLEHCGDDGQNIAGTNKWADYSTSVKMWYDEIALTPGGDGKVSSFSSGTGHYTQVVWKATTKVGCSRVESGDSMNTGFVICNYKIPGNMQGSFAQNVIPLSAASGSSGGSAGRCDDVKVGGREWHDTDGHHYDCHWYEQSTHCQDHGHSYAYKGYTAMKACCACGGGTGTR